MARFPIFVLAVSVIASGCGSDTPSSPASNTQLVKFTAALLASSEVPPIAGAESAASGTAAMNFHVAKDSTGAITTSTVDFQVTLAGFPATTSITIAHIHTGVAGVVGAVLVNTSLAAGEVVLTGGSGSFTRLNMPMTAADAAAIIANPSRFYFNVHSAANPGGVIRGQMVAVP